MRYIFKVSATHKHPAYCFEDTIVMASQDGDNCHYAEHSKLGCGKTYRGLPSDAVVELFLDHACRITKIEEIAKGPWLRRQDYEAAR